MNVFQAILLGVIQGLTEFLPVSSSGHLAIAQSLFPGFSQPGLLFDVVLHAGTLGAVLYYFRKRLLKFTSHEIKILVLGTIPTVIIGFLFNDWIEAGFSDLGSVGIQLGITGLLCIFIDLAKGKSKSIALFDSFLIGLGQAIAIIPGISRSGSTIFVASVRGIERKKAAEFSFLLSIPAIFGAIILQIAKHGFSDNISITAYSIGFLVSFFVGLMSIGMLLKLLVSHQFKFFGIYSLILGTIVFLMR